MEPFVQWISADDAAVKQEVHSQAAVQGGVYVSVCVCLWWGVLCLVHTFVVLLFVIHTIEQGEEFVGWVRNQLGAVRGEGPGKVTSPKFIVGEEGGGHGRV